ncbi:hypothetical protein A9Q73_09615 [Bermanella sp. 47_1433_sub80_T6]|nr:hypothetical protein A9Q73_09615 [Bermanella sp. 47_1433_sub80_T6]
MKHSLLIKTLFAATLGLMFSLSSYAYGHAHVSIAYPKDGAVVQSPVVVKFSLEGMTLAPAGTGGPNSGHHHLIVDGELPDLKKPMGGSVTHFGKAQSETVLELAPGKHTLQLILGDKTHTPHMEPVISKKITITVK